MSRKILDTSVLIYQWRRRRTVTDTDLTDRVVIEWSEELVELHGTDEILTPIRLEFICGAHSSQELQLYESFLGVLNVADGGNILTEDWQEAGRLARRVPPNGKPRQLGDCLVRAIANRLRVDVITFDEGFPR
jgi:predicted nucleic acid-binding protein